MPKGGLGSTKEALIMKTHSRSFAVVPFSQSVRVTFCSCLQNEIPSYRRRDGRQIEGYTHPLPHIISNNHIISQTLPGRLEPPQALWELPAHTATRAYSSAIHFSYTSDHCKFNEHNKPGNMKSTPLYAVQNMTT